MSADKIRIATLSGIILFCSLFASTAVAQNVQFTQGNVGTGMDNTIQIPIAAYPGRGDASLPVTLYYSSRVWRLDHLTTLNYGSYYQSIAQAIFAEHSTAGWKTSLDIPVIEWPKTTDTYYYSGGPQCDVCTGFGGYRVRRVYIHMPDGAKHELRQDDQPRIEGIVKTGTFYAVDGSRLRYDSTGDNTGTLYLPNGSRYILNGSAAQFIDRNGNTLNYSASTRQWADTLGRPLGIPLPSDPAALPLNPDGTRTFTYTAKGVDNTSRTYTLTWKNLADALTPDPETNQTPIRLVVGSEYLPNPNQVPNTTTNRPVFQSQGLFNDDAPDGEGVNTIVVGQMGKWAGQGQVFNPLLLAEVRLPNGLSYKFSYNIYGEIDKVIYPTGAYDFYKYSDVPSVGDNSVPYTKANRGVIKRQLSAKGDGSDLAAWNYASTGTVITTTAPDGTVMESYRHNYLAPQHGNKFLWAFGFEDARNGMVYDERVKASSTGPILRRKLIQWEQTSNAVPPRPGAPSSGNNTEQAYRNVRPSKEVSIVLDTGANALAKTVTYSYDTTYQLTTGLDLIASTESYYAEVIQQTAQSGSIGDIQSGSAARSNQTCYLTKPSDICSLTGESVSSYDYLNYNILGLAAVSVIKDASNNVVAKTETSYDQGGAYATVIYPDYSGTDYTSPGAAPRGMATTIKRYVDVGANISLQTHAQFDQFGSLKVFTNERGKQTLMDYASTHKYAYPTEVTTPAPDPTPGDPLNPRGASSGFTSSTTYDSTTGLVLTTVDANGRTTAFSYRNEQDTPDPLNRLRKVERPDGGWTKYTFNDVSGDLYTLTETKQDDTHTVKTYQYFDAMGRASRAFMSEGLVNGVESYITSDMKYDPTGRTCGASNPYRTQTRNGTVASAGDCNWSANWTTTNYDALGRSKQVTLPDGSSVQSEYAGVYTTVTDQAGKKRRQKTDAFGRIVRVDEPVLTNNTYDLGPVQVPKQPTSYEYDTLGNLIHIAQNYNLQDGTAGVNNDGVQHRYFKYDALSRLTYERQVEQAAVFNAADSLTGNNQWSRKIVYDENGYLGLLTSQHDARQIQTRYDYDNLNRIITISYPNDATTPAVDYFYDLVRFTNSQDTRTVYNLGRLVEMQTAAVTLNQTIVTLPSTSQVYNYDLMGRVANNRQKVGDYSYQMINGYNLGGALTSQRYPSNRVVTFDYGDAGRLQTVSSGATTYASQFKYEDERGLLSSFLLGNASNQVKESYTYNSRLQLQSIELKKDTSVLQRYEYKYGRFVSGSLDELKNNGQIAQIDSFIGTAKQWQQQFEYDALSRLSKVSEYQGTSTTNLTYQMNYDYDVFGNRYQKQASNANSLPYVEVADAHISKQTNRFTTSGVSYDDAGNIISDSRFTGSQYLYDANNRQRQVSQLDGTGAVKSVYDGAGQRVATMTGNAVDNVLVYDAGGKLVAEYGQTSVNRGTSYIFTDHQSSTRAVINSTGAVTSRHDYQPFGAEIGAGAGLRTTSQGYGQLDSARQKYAGMETDDGSANSHTLWRKYDSSSGRWTSPDPYGGSMSTGNPQSLNRYTYVNNDPVNQTDPSGLVPYSGADVGWSGFEGWGGGFDFTSRASAGQEIIRVREAERDSAIADTRQAKLINDGVKDGTITRDQAEEMIESNPNLEIEGEADESSYGNHATSISGNSIIVIIWDPVATGNFFQSQGHVSYITMENDMSYSWQGEGALFNTWTKRMPSEIYTNERSMDSAGVGYILDFGPKLNAKFAAALKNAYGNQPYNPITNNCTKAFKVAMNSIRKELKIKEKVKGFLPEQMRSYIVRNLDGRYLKATRSFPMHIIAE